MVAEEKSQVIPCEEHEGIDIPPDNYPMLNPTIKDALTPAQKMRLFCEGQARRMLYICLAILGAMFVFDTFFHSSSELKVPLFEVLKFIVAGIVGYLFSKSDRSDE
ncbi:MAG: hypothetical protein Q8873_00475 [Bacillota bacterium]|nr:hypothetical protein [Bacillota bacterium]